MDKNRIEYVDWLRGFAILLVVMGHLLEYNGYQNCQLYGIIYSFHMPLFFCISGFVTIKSCRLNEKSRALDYVRYIKKKFIAIMIPCIVWSLIVNPLFFSKAFDVNTIFLAFEAQFITNKGYWFLPCLFNLLVLFTIWKMIMNRFKTNNIAVNATVLAIILAGVILMSSIDFMRSVSSYFIPYFFGVMLGMFENLRVQVVENRYVYAVCFLLYCLMVGHYGNTSYEVVNKVLRLMLGLLAIPVLFNIFEHVIFPVVIKSVLSTLGQNTLVIYLAHYIFVKSVPVPFEMGIWCQMICFLAIAVLIGLSVVLFAKILEKSPILALLMLGKNNK